MNDPPAAEDQALAAPVVHRLEVSIEAGSTRLDLFVATSLPHHSRSRWRELISDGQVTVDGRRVRPAHKVHTGEKVEVCEPPVQDAGLLAQDLPLQIVFEDEAIIVVNKASGMVVHPAPGHRDGTLVNALLHHVPNLAVGGKERPGIVHRIDKDTSGLIVCAKHDQAHRALSTAFKDRTVDKRYRAFTLGQVRSEQHLLTGHMRDAKDRRRFTTKMPAPDEEDGTIRRAEAHIRPRLYAGGVTDIEVQLLTGRTHQIRAQLADIGHPICEDGLYGGVRSATRVMEGPVRLALRQLARQGLHAAGLSFPHPVTGEQVSFTAELPPDLANLVTAMDASTSKAGSY